MRKKTIIILLVLTLSIYAMNFNVQSAEENNYRTNSLDLTPHDPIKITSDSDFLVFPGTGTVEDPYVIEGYSITTTDDKGIYITYTTKHFVIRNCYIEARHRGIHIYDVADGTANVINNTCNDNGYGIFLSSSVSSTVINNTCNKNYIGIYLLSSGSFTVANNTCNNNDYGIRLADSDSSTVTNNTCSNNGEYGIVIHNSDNILIHHNIFVDNNLGGSYFGSSQASDDRVGKNTWYDPETKEGNYWSDLGDKCTYKIDGKAHSKDLYPLNRSQSCPNPITMTILSIVLPLLVSVAILAFVVPKYGIPYFRKRKAERPLRKAERKDLKLRVLDNKTNRIIIKVYLSLLFLSTAILPWVIEPGEPVKGWALFGIFGLLYTFIPLAIIITTILFYPRIARMKLWKKIVITLCVLIFVGFVIWGGIIATFFVYFE